MMKSILSAAGLIAAAAAFTQPTSQTYGALLTPDLTTPVTTGQTYDITWSPKQPADGVTVSLVLCNGPGSNCVLQGSAIIEGVPASAGKYSWNVPCNLPAGTQNTASGYGMLIIVDGTGEFQYSTQFSVNTGASCSSSSTTATTTSSVSSSSSSSGSSSSSSSAAHTDSASSWMAWNSTSTSTTSSNASASKSYTWATSSTAQAVSTSASASYTYVKPSSSAAATTAAATSAKPQTSAFTGAAALPTAFLNVAGLVGGLAVLAL